MPEPTSQLDWRRRAHCVGRDPEIWFPKPKDDKTAEKAKRICNHCPVTAECNTEAERDPRTTGIWAGKRRFPPRNVPRIPDLAPCGTLAAYRRHMRNRESPCRPCSQANLRYEQDQPLERYRKSVERRAQKAEMNR